MVRLEVTLDAKKAFKDLRKEIDEVSEDVIQESARELAKEMRQGKSEWPVRTGLSRDSFYAKGDIITNRQGYSGFIERKYNALEKYVRANLTKVAQRIINRKYRG